MKKKLLAAILVFAMIAQTVTIFAAESVVMASDNTVVSGNEEIVYIAGENTVNAKVKFAMDMGLVTHYIPAQLATRKDLKTAMRLLFKDDSLYDRYYTDDNDSATISVDEAIVLFMDAAGYAPYIKMNTAADALAYRSEATRRGLISANGYKLASSKFTVELFYNMFYDLLNMPIFGASYSNVGASYAQTESTLMYTALKLRKIKGIVNANSYTAIKGDAVADVDSLIIGKTIYRSYGLKNLDDFLGYSVIAYVDAENMLCSVAVDTVANNYIKINGGADIKEATLNYLEYYTNGNRTATIKLNPYAAIMYNNVLAEDFKAKDFFIEGGSIRFIDNDGDKMYDVIFVEELISFYPKFVDSRNFVIEDNLGNKYDVSDVAYGRKYLGVHKEDGSAVELETILNTTPISVAVIYDTNVLSEVIVINPSTYEGVYTDYKASAYEPYTIGEKTFRLAPVYSQEENNKLPYKIGDRIKVTLDPYGFIMKAEDVSNSERYGFLFGFNNNDGLFSSDMQAMILPAGGKTEVRSLAKSVLYNDRERLSEDKFASSTAVPELYANGKVKPQLIRFKMNSKGEISDIITATLNNLEFGAFNDTKNGFQINFALSDGSPKEFIYYGGTIKAIQGKYRFKNTMLFNIPINASDYIEYAHTSTVSTLTDMEKYSMVLYDIDDYYVIGAAVQYFMPSGEDHHIDGKGSSGAIYVDKGQKIDSKTGEVINYMAYVRGGNAGSVDVAPRTVNSLKRGDNSMFGTRRASVNTMDDLRMGDVVKWSTNSDGHMGIFMVTFAPDFSRGFESQLFEYDLYDNKIPTESDWGEDTYMFAKVLSKDINGMVINADKTSKGTNKAYNRVLRILSSQTVTVYDVSENEATKETFASVKIGDYVYVQYTDLNVVDIIVYRP